MASSSWRGCASSFNQPMSQDDENAAQNLMNTIYRINCQDTGGRPQLKDVIYRTGDRDRDILRHVFRWDLTPYQQVFQNGLRVNLTPSQGRDDGSSYSLIDYLKTPNATPLDSRQPSKFGFISTTISNSWFPPVVDTTELYRYEIYAPGGIWVAVSLAQHANNNTRYDEVAFPKGIAPQYIRSVQIFKLLPQPNSNNVPKVERVKREVIINANFNPQSHPLKVLKIEDPVCEYVVSDNVRSPLRSTVHHPQSQDDTKLPDRPDSQDDTKFPGGPGGRGGGFPGGPGGRGGRFPGGPGGRGGRFPGGPGGRGGRFPGGPGGRGGRFPGGPGGRGGRFPGGPECHGDRFPGGPDCWDDGPDCWDDGPDSWDDGPDSWDDGPDCWDDGPDYWDDDFHGGPDCGDDRFPGSPGCHGDRFRGGPGCWDDRFRGGPECGDDRSPGQPRRGSPPRSKNDSEPQRAAPSAANKTNNLSPQHLTSITEWYKDGVTKVKSYVDAAFRTSTQNSAYYFLKSVGILVDYAPGTGDDKFVEGPMYVVEMFPFLKGTPFGEHRIDCAFGSDDENQAYIFSANLCALITYNTQEGNANSKILKGPMPITEMFSCLKGTAFENGIGTAIEGRRGDVILFKGDQCARMLYKIDELIDVGTVAGVFPSLNGHLLETELDAAHASHVESEGAYVYKGDRFAYFYFGPGPDKIGDDGQVYKIGSQAQAMSRLYNHNRGLDLIPSDLQYPAPTPYI